MVIIPYLFFLSLSISLTNLSSLWLNLDKVTGRNRMGQAGSCRYRSSGEAARRFVSPVHTVRDTVTNHGVVNAPVAVTALEIPSSAGI